MEIEYRDYIISPSEWLPGKYEYRKKDYNGEPVKSASSIQEAKQEIDFEMYLRSEWPIDTGNQIIGFCSLETALTYLHGHGARMGAKALFTFNSI